MAVGQRVLGEAVLDVAELDRLGALIEAEEQDRSVRHARQLRHVLALHRVYGRAGMELSTPAYLALLLGSSEARATRLLTDAQSLEALGALGPMQAGQLTVEQARVVVDLLGPVDPGTGAALWQRLAGRLEADRADGVVRPPARLRELLNRWLMAADPEGMAARRREAVRQDADVSLWARDDGLTDLVGRGLSAADALACLDRLDRLAAAEPTDQRTAGQRRRDALVDLLLGRQSLPLGDGCCPPGAAAPCGAQILVHVPLATALGDSDEPAELVGHGPLDPAALSDLLAAAPVLRRVWVDAHGTPVSLDRRSWTPGRNGLAHALRDIASGAPPPDAQVSRHDPSPYRPPRPLQQLVRVRAPRCEWPGCGHRSVRAGAGCDLDHDLAWPHGPTCACNLGPLCRRHHRVKQQGWTKRRRADGSVAWTAPTGRRWTSPGQHPTPASSRPVPVASGVWRLAVA